MNGDNSFALAMIAFGLVILVIGCSVAVYRDREAEKESELDRELMEMVNEITTDFAAGSGALSLTRLSTGTIRIDEGRSARIMVETMKGDELVIHIPDEGTFQEMTEDGKSSSMKKSVPVATNDGRVLPGKLEVTLLG
jgi:hypothetical protein